MAAITAWAITTICYAASPLFALALPVAVGFLVLACVAPAPAVVAGCSLAVLEGTQVPVAGLGALGATESAFLIIAVGWGWRAITGAPGVRYPQIADYPVIAFILCLPLGLVVGAPPTVVLRLGVMWTAFFLVFLTVKGFTPRELRNVLLALGISAALLGAVGVLGYLSGGGARVSQGGATVTGRAVGGIPDPNYYGAYLQMAAVPLLALVVAGATRWRAVAAAAVAVASLGIVLSLSRGAIIGMVLGVGVVILAWSRTRAVSIALVAVLAATTAANLNPLLSSSTTEVVSERLTSIGIATENNKRTLIWRETLDEIVAHPLGVGALQFSTVSERRGLTQRGVPLENVHNQYLNIAIELGVAGLLFYLLWLVRIGWDLVSEMGRRRRETYPIAVGVAGGLLGYSFQALTVSQYRVETILAVFFVLAGVAAAARAWPDDPTPQDSAPVTTASMARS